MTELIEKSRTGNASGADRRILVISRIGIPPPNGGNRVRSAALLRELRQLGYEVHFAGIRMPPEEKAATRAVVDEWVWDFAPPAPAKGWTRFCNSLAYRIHQAFRQAGWVNDRLDGLFSDHWLAEAAQLQAERGYVRVLVPYVHYSRFFEAFPASCLKILDTIDAYSRPRLNLAQGATEYYVRRYSPSDERRALLRASRVIAIQKHEATYFQQLLQTEKGVSVVGHIAEPVPRTFPFLAASRLGYVGSRKNNFGNPQTIQWFLHEIWPEVHRRAPEAEVHLAGLADDDSEALPGVRVLGPVPDLADFYRQCPIIINPVRNGPGLKIKTIEALLHGRPVVTTSVGAQGLESFAGHGLFVCDSTEAFSNTVIELLADLPGTFQWGEAALRRAKEYVADNRQNFIRLLQA